MVMAEIFSRIDVENRDFAHCIVVVDPRSRGTPNNINMGYNTVTENTIV